MLDPNETRLSIAAKRFHEKTLPQPDGCIHWTAARNKGGYGQVGFLGVNMTAHRVAWFLTHGEIPKGRHVLHRCDVRHCVNPDHLFIGTNDDNVRDMVVKGRQSRGVTHPRAILSEDQARAIAADPRGGRELAHEYGVSRDAISAIRNGRSWRHLGMSEGPARLPNPAALTDAQAVAVRQDPRPMREIADEYGVARETIRRVKMGRTYRAASGPVTSGRRVLTDAEVWAIRADTRPQYETAAAHGISQALCSLIKLARSYAHVPNQDGSAYAPVRANAKPRADAGLARTPKTA